MAAIDIDIEVLDRVIDNLNGCIDDLNSSKNSVEKIKNAIPNAWQGAAVYDYTECLGVTKRKIDSLERDIQSIRNALRGTVSNVREAESKLMSEMSGNDFGGGHCGGR